MLKLKLLIISLLSSALCLVAEMRYNPLNNLIYSHPETSDINQDQYRGLIRDCIEIENRILVMNQEKTPSDQDILKQCNHYLKAIGTPTAMRLMKDLKSNKVYYADGSFMKKIFR